MNENDRLSYNCDSYKFADHFYFQYVREYGWKIAQVHCSRCAQGHFTVPLKGDASWRVLIFDFEGI